MFAYFKVQKKREVKREVKKREVKFKNTKNTVNG